VKTKRYNLPEGMRYATLEERKEFYQKEFDTKRMEEWFFRVKGKTVFAVIMGRHTRIFRRKYKEDMSTTVLIDEYNGFEDVKAQILEFLPEAVYYDRNMYGDKGNVLGQELAFDLDPENLTCPIHGTLADKMRRRQGLGFCEPELKMVKAETARLYEELKKSFSDMKIVYSGRGFHIHVFDENTYAWKYRMQKELARKLKAKGFLIDEWVTTGGMRLIRLPYSLHGMVSRIVIPLEVKELEAFNPVLDKRCIPEFLHLS
jgi:DNA primase catalytic subunit